MKKSLLLTPLCLLALAAGSLPVAATMPDRGPGVNDALV